MGDTYRAKRNTPTPNGVWRQGTDRELDDAAVERFAGAIASGQIVRVGAALIEDVRGPLEFDDEKHEHPGYGQPLEGIDAPADGTVVDLPGDDDLPDDPEFDVDPGDDSH